VNARRDPPGYDVPMSKVIFLADHRGAPLSVAPGELPPPGQPALDQRARPLRDLRISVTDRCNFRCTYCMPREVFDSSYSFMPHSALLSFEEISRLAGIFTQLGVEKIRLTGGEPLLRKHIENLVGMLADLRTPQGRPLDLTLTTNGSVLARKAAALKSAGLTRVTVSLDALDAAMFQGMSDSGFTPDDVLRGIDAAADAGLAPVKVNMVVRKGLNDGQILPMAERFRHSGHILRFIEYMDVGNSNGWNLDEVVPSRSAGPHRRRASAGTRGVCGNGPRGRTLALCGRRRRDRRHLQRHARVLRRLYARAPVARRQALYVPLRPRRPRPARPVARRRDGRRTGANPGGHMVRARRQLFRAARPEHGGSVAQDRDELHRWLNLHWHVVLSPG